MMKIVMFAVVSSILVMTGCAANGPAFSPAENPGVNKSLVYLYRSGNIMACMASFPVYIDEVERGRLKNNGYLVYSVDPGKRIIETGGGDTRLTVYLDVVAGQDYYIRWSIELGDTFATISHIFSLQLIPKEYAIFEIQKTKKSE